MSEYEMVGDHYVTAMTNLNNGTTTTTAVACRCGWFTVAIGAERLLSKVNGHMKAQR